MTREQIYERLNDIFREVLDDDSIVLYDETTANDVEGWDSFEHINLIIAIEDEFSVKIPMEKIIAMRNVGEMVDTLYELKK